MMLFNADYAFRTGRRSHTTAPWHKEHIHTYNGTTTRLKLPDSGR
jgi:hypothetical protein